MSTRSARSLVVPPLASLLFLLTVLPGAAAGSEPPARVAVESASAAGLEIAIQGPFESARLTIRRIGGPVVHRGTYTSTPIQLFPRLSDEGEALEDGAYVYELLVYPPDEVEPRSDRDREREHGADEPTGPVVVSDLFELRDGRLVSKGETAAEVPGGTVDSTGNALATRDSLVNDDLIVEGSVCASDSDVCADGEGFLTLQLVNAQLKLKDASPVLWLADTTQNHEDWLLRSDGGTFRIQNADSGFDALVVEPLDFRDGIHIDVFGRIGFGTSSPQESIHVFDDNPAVRIEESDELEASFEIQVETSDRGEGPHRFLSIIEPGTTPLILFAIDSTAGRIGLGTGTPTASLDIAPRSGTADLRLASAGESWRFTNRGEVMTVSRDGSGTEELTIRDGLDAVGPTLVVAGSVQGTQLLNSSSREIKTGFAPVDPGAVLAGLSELPVTSWRYRHEPPGARHVGPVAEDFQARFGLGDGETISTVDAVGVLMAAVQALHGENRALSRRLEELEGGGAAPSEAAAEPVPADVLVAWNEAVLAAAEAEDRFLTLKGLHTAALMHLAVHDALNTIEPRYRTYLPAEPAEEGAPAEAGDPLAATAEAAYRVAVSQYPDRKETFEAERRRWLEAVPAGPARDAGVKIGGTAAERILAAREGDGWDNEAKYRFHPMAPGVYAEFADHSGTPEGFVFGAGWATSRPFVLESPDHFRAPPPPAIGSDEYTRAFDEVKEVGRYRSPARTPDQTHLALWWKEFVESSHNRLARELVAEEGLDLWRAARMFALLEMSIFDGYVNVFENKFHYNHWRPYTAIRWAANDGNPDTEPDPEWDNTHRHTYAFPSYPSAHGSACAAAMTVLADVFGDDRPGTIAIPKVDEAGPLSDKIPMDPVTRSFPSFSAAARECALSRVYLGIHFRYDSEAGTELGSKVGRYVVDSALD
jgi:membrane-associated phospholipid phosphatase